MTLRLPLDHYARLSVAPMMDWTESSFKSVS